MLAGSIWVLTHGSATATLEFDDDSFWGTDACNRVRGRYASDETAARINGPVMSTRMACWGDAAELSEMVEPLLVDGTRLDLGVAADDGDALVLTSDDGVVLRFARQP